MPWNFKVNRTYETQLFTSTDKVMDIILGVRKIWTSYTHEKISLHTETEIKIFADSPLNFEWANGHLYTLKYESLDFILPKCLKLFCLQTITLYFTNIIIWSY